MTRDQIVGLIDKIDTMRKSHDSIGPTGITGHFSKEEQKEMVAWGRLALQARATKTQAVVVTAGDIEAWTTGDADFLESELLERLNAAQEDISRGAKKQVQVVVTITE